jgi:DNA-directed RNA polymerase subunit N (RpoN/RPB10)
MNQHYYFEYPIRCPCCGDLIDTFSDQFESLIAEYGHDKLGYVLDEMGINEMCCRNAFMNPRMVYLNNEKPEKVTMNDDIKEYYIETEERFQYPDQELILPEYPGIPSFNPQIFNKKVYRKLNKDDIVEMQSGRTYLSF